MIEIIGYDKGGNVKAIINGENYKFATVEFYGGASVYGVLFPGDDSFTFLSRSKKAKKFYLQFAEKISNYIKLTPPTE